jgi:hypothetical protein
MIVERRKDARIDRFSPGEYGCPERDRTLYSTQHSTTQHSTLAQASKIRAAVEEP